MTAPFVVIPRGLLADILTALQAPSTDTEQAGQLARLLEERIDVADRRVAA